MNSEICVEVITYGSKKVLTMKSGGSLKEELLQAGVNVSMPCGGMGRCGKCKVKFLAGAPEITPGEKSYLPTVSDVEKSLLSPEEIASGVRLLCVSKPEADCVVEIIADSEEGMVAETAGSTDGEMTKADRGVDAASGKSGAKGANYGIAIDLGTTTIAAALVAEDGRIIDTASCTNSQRRYGADVISRISAAEDAAVRDELQRLVWEDIEKLVNDLSRLAAYAVSEIAIAGNTTMLHLLTGKDVSGLGVYPYTPVSLDMETIDSEDIIPKIIAERLKDINGIIPPITLLPGISAFVGADIVSGLYYLQSELNAPKNAESELANFVNDSERVLFIDLGTNGEMALIEGNRITATSTAAGPVFEAGGISCGVASVPGAITHVEIFDDEKGSDGSFAWKLETEGKAYAVSYTTIADKSPIGLCGTGVMELVSELVKCGIIDETGLLDKEFFDRGFPVTEDGSVRLTQQDIRNVQMGKAAIASGIRTLTEGQTPDVIFIAGGFGTHIDIEKIQYLKMLPEDFTGKTVAIGNSSLKGAAEYLAEIFQQEKISLSSSGIVNEMRSRSNAEAVIKTLVKQATVMQLAETPDFDETYLDSMGF